MMLKGRCDLCLKEDGVKIVNHEYLDDGHYCDECLIRWDGFEKEHSLNVKETKRKMVEEFKAEVKPYFIECPMCIGTGHIQGIQEHELRQMHMATQTEQSDDGLPQNTVASMRGNNSNNTPTDEALALGAQEVPKPRGRPKGSKNKPKTNTVESMKTNTVTEGA